MRGSRQHQVLWRLAILAVMLVAASCGRTTDDASNTIEAGPVVADGEGLAVRIAGVVEGELLCPGGRRPCVPFDGAIEPDADGAAWVSGRIVDGVLTIDDQQPLPSDVPVRDYANRCADDDIGEPPPGEMLEELYEGLAERPPGFVDLWDSEDGVLHLGISGDPAEAELFLDGLGIADQVCIVTGFPHPDADLESVQREVGELAINAGYENFGSSRDGWEGTVSIDLPRFDAAFRSQLDNLSEVSGVPIEARASVEVLDGTLDDYEAALAAVAVSPDAGGGLTATCGPVVFSSAVRPDLDEFPPLDDDARSALDELVNGETGVEAGGFDENYRWSIASRTDSELVLFGQGLQDSQDLVDARFDRRDGAWRPTGWGGCRVEISAVGLGPAEVAFDPENPPQPDDTELALLINEQACASGEAPIDREIVPVITEAAESVTIVVLVAPVEGGADCPSNPWHPITVELSEPLGSRQLVDGHQFPTEPVGPIETLDG
ncbi:MAG: hypothetical protein AAF467_02475 [Actinomycetota bacterium]